MRSTPQGRRLVREAVGVLVPLTFAFSPVISMLIATRPVMGPPLESGLRMAAALTSAVGLGYIALRRRGNAPANASNALGLPLFLIGIYPFAVAGSKALGVVNELPIAWCYLSVAAFAGWRAAARLKPEPGRTLHHTLQAVAAVLAVFSIVVLVDIGTSTLSPAVAAAVAAHSTPLAMPASPRHRPDVYHLVLDGMGRQDVLAERYGLSLDSTVAGFRRLGFRVADDGYANYVQTHLSLASMLNVTYVEDLGPIDKASNDRRPLRALIDQARVPGVLKRLGYRVVQIGTGSHAEGIWQEADERDSPQLWWSEPEMGAVSLTPMKALLWLGIGQRHFLRRSLHVFEAFEQARHGQAPRYVYAHVMMPHPPFYADADGQYVPQVRPTSGGDASFYSGTAEEYQSGYRAQAAFALRRALDAATRIVDASTLGRRDAIIIITGDHGPRLGMDARQPTAESGRFTLPVFLAIRWPAGMSPSTSPRSLVNLYRSVFREAFEMNLPPLPDAGYVSAFTTPYATIPVEGLDGPHHLTQ
jgi:Sulfatase